VAVERRAILAAWWTTKWAKLTLASRGDIERRQARLWLDRAAVEIVRHTPAVAQLAGRRLAEFPIVTPAEIRAGFARWNTLGLTRAEAESAAAQAEAGGNGEVAPGVVAGFSTGSSGERGVFLADEAERARYLGSTLARLMTTAGLFGPRRIALVLRADSRLYRDVERTGGFRFRFFGLEQPAGERAEALRAFDPDILIAPAHVLADLARRAEDAAFALPGLRRLFWGAEPMGDAERVWIGEALGARPDPIYQATEGFLGAPCAEGVLHLNEDSMVVELEPVEGTDAFRPVVTDLYRASQPVIRVRLDDLVDPMPERCHCGSPLRAIWPVMGRMGDLWRWPGLTVRAVEVWTAMEGALGPKVDWRATGWPGGVELQLGDPALAAQAVAAISALVGARAVTVAPGPPRMDGPKRRRVRWAP
jgi:putative adenylate-forming enzyme